MTAKINPIHFLSVVCLCFFFLGGLHERTHGYTFGKPPVQNPQVLLPENLKCEYQVNPLGIDVDKPRLSWTMNSNIRGQGQTAYQVIISTSQITRFSGPGGSSFISAL